MISANAFLSAAEARYETASELQLRRCPRVDVIYLAGYAIECSLKALIIRRTPFAKLDDLEESVLFRSAAGHRLDSLLHYLVSDCGENLPSDFDANVRYAARRWSTDLRYSSKKVSHAASAKFLANAELITSWIARRI